MRKYRKKKFLEIQAQKQVGGRNAYKKKVLAKKKLGLKWNLKIKKFNVQMI